MATVTITLNTSPVEYPAGTVLGKFLARLTSPTGAFAKKDQLLDLPLPPTIVYENVPVGPWNFSASQLTASGNSIGASFALSGEVPVPPPVPGVVVVSASASVA